jgi:hypothetical protein
MAWITVSIRQLEIAIRMTRLTRRRKVRASQRELRRAMIEGGGFPNNGRVTCFARMAESRSHVIGIRRKCKICRMTYVAVGIDELIVAIDMTRLTWSCDMRTRQGEFRAVVTECRGDPGIGRMT